MSNSAFRPGVLCYVKPGISYSGNSGNSGKIVQIVRKPVEGEIFLSTSGHRTKLLLLPGVVAWIVSGKELLSWSEKGRETVYGFKEIAIFQSRLIPISNGGLETETHQRLLLSPPVPV